MTRVRARHDVTPLEYRVSWEQMTDLARDWMAAHEILIATIERVLGTAAAAECMFELASGRTPRFIPVKR